ncbi:PREDICTED: acid-sensing ion channel 5-like [Priapulus caudatus]|uniref:Acid-sensing ion channel 5-like n=1 Tax=Priapulus caudatus TaxID=37621 RepID=A0ABM1F433_PRICU|nr:PREDICTED: acid-sensing ion channel 5-like [Priapulus caudatus]
MQVLRDFVDSTSAHGVYRAATPMSLFRRTVWSLLFVLLFGFAIVQAYNILEKYLSYPKLVDVDVIYAKELMFPAVTICNQNAYAGYKLDAYNISVDTVQEAKICDPFDYEYSYENDDDSCDDAEVGEQLRRQLLLKVLSSLTWQE